MKCSGKEIMPQEKKAGLYMFMGTILEVVAFLWSIKRLVPDAVFIVVAIVGLIPLIKMIRAEFSEPTDDERVIWEKAEISTGRLILWMLLFYWMFICVDKVFELPISADPIYMVPGWFGVQFLFMGYHFKLYKMLSEEDEE